MSDQAQSATGSDTLYYRFRHSLLQVQTQPATGLDTACYRFRYSVLQVQTQPATGSNTILQGKLANSQITATKTDKTSYMTTF